MFPLMDNYSVLTLCVSCYFMIALLQAHNLDDIREDINELKQDIRNLKQDMTVGTSRYCMPINIESMLASSSSNTPYLTLVILVF